MSNHPVIDSTTFKGNAAGIHKDNDYLVVAGPDDRFFALTQDAVHYFDDYAEYYGPRQSSNPRCSRPINGREPGFLDEATHFLAKPLTATDGKGRILHTTLIVCSTWEMKADTVDWHPTAPVPGEKAMLVQPMAVDTMHPFWNNAHGTAIGTRIVVPVCNMYLEAVEKLWYGEGAHNHTRIPFGGDAEQFRAKRVEDARLITGGFESTFNPADWGLGTHCAEIFRVEDISQAMWIAGVELGSVDNCAPRRLIPLRSDDAWALTQWISIRGPREECNYYWGPRVTWSTLPSDVTTHLLDELVVYGQLNCRRHFTSVNSLRRVCKGWQAHIDGFYEKAADAVIAATRTAMRTKLISDWIVVRGLCKLNNIAPWDIVPQLDARWTAHPTLMKYWRVKTGKYPHDTPAARAEAKKAPLTAFGNRQIGMLG